MKYIRLEKTKHIENTGYILINKYSHIIYPIGTEAIHDDNLEEVDSKAWEVFNVTHETKNAYYGRLLLGIGMFNVRVEKSNCRQFTEKELEAYKGKSIGIYGSHTGNFSGQSYDVNITQVVSKWKEKKE